ncbi:MAG: ABC transporter permease [Acidimicrobiia bacterium]
MSRWRQLRVASFEGVVGLLAAPRAVIGAAVMTALGIGLFVAITGLSVTSTRQVADDFDALRATEVRITGGGLDGDPLWIPEDYTDRLATLAGFESAMAMGRYDSAPVYTASPRSARNPTGVAATLTAVDFEHLDTIGPTLQGIDPAELGHIDPSVPPVIVGSRIASQLGIGTIDGYQAVWINGQAFMVTAILADSTRRRDLLDAALIDRTAAGQLLGRPQTEEVMVAVKPGAAAGLAEQAPLALVPQAPQSVAATAPPDSRQFRQQIEGRIEAIVVAMSAVALLVGAVGIASSMTISVAGRRWEIGLRQAIGGSRTSIFTQFLTEAAMVGAIGGLLGASLGIVATVGFARYNNWRPVINPSDALLGVLIGLGVGIAAGFWPACRAAQTDPAESLRAT